VRRSTPLTEQLETTGGVGLTNRRRGPTRIGARLAVVMTVLASGLAMGALQAAPASADPLPAPVRTAPLVAPTQLPPTSGPESITVNWKPPTSLTPSGQPDHYTIAMLAPGATQSTSTDAFCPMAPCGYTFTGVASGTHTFVVFANDAVGNSSPPSNPETANAVTVASYAGAGPLPPVQLAPSYSPGSVDINWLPSLNLSPLPQVWRYNIYSVSPNKLLTITFSIACSTTPCTFKVNRADYQMTLDGPYEFFVAAIDSANNMSAPSNVEVVYFPGTPPPPPPVQTTPGQSPGVITYNWTQPLGTGTASVQPHHFGLVWVNPNHEWWAAGPVFCSTPTCSANINVSAPGPYELYVESFDAAGNSSVPSNPVATVVAGSDTVAPTPPLAFRVTGQTPNTISASWQPSADNVAVSYYWAWYKDPTGFSTAWGPIPCCSFNYPNMTVPGTYTLWATAWDAAGNQSQQSNPGAAIQGPVGGVSPGQPTNVTASGGNAQATVSWTAPTGAGLPVSSYTVTASPGGQTMTVSGSQTSATVLNLTNGTTYTFTVYASNAAGNGPPSAPSNAVTPVGPPPVAPTNVTATAGNAQATVTWTPPSGNGGSVITSYTVTASGGQSTTACGTCTSAAMTGLTNGVTYTFTVYATNAYGNSPSSSPSNAVTPARLPGVPANVTATPGANDAVVTWTPPSDNGGANIDAYRIRLYVNGAYSSETSVCGTCTQYDWGNLTPGDPVYFVVWSHNSVGYSSSGGVSNEATPGTGAQPGAPYGDNTGADALVADSTGRTWYNNVDGVYAGMVIPGNMNVPLINISTGLMRAGVTPNANERVVGHNTRPIQIFAAVNSTAANSGEFVGVGITAGCMHSTGIGNPPNCTGIASNGGVYKRIYVDGCTIVLAPNGCTGDELPGYYQSPFGAVSVNEYHTFQIQRHWFGATTGYRFGVWVDGLLLGQAQQTFMFGGSSEGSESATNTGAENGWPVHKMALDMSEPCFGPAPYGPCAPSTKVHYYGDPSTYPPGADAAYSDLQGWQLQNPNYNPVNHTGCQVYAPNTTALAATGYC
jgi:hypothetical protein